MHTPQDRHPAAAASSSPTWAVKLAAEREEETIFYRYLSPCFPFVTTPLQNRKTHQGLTGAPGAPALSQGQPGLELPLARAVHTQAVISPNWVKCKREELREQQDFVSSSIPASAGWDAAAERLFRRQDHAATGALSPALRPCSATAFTRSVYKCSGIWIRNAWAKKAELPRLLSSSSPLALCDQLISV